LWYWKTKSVIQLQRRCSQEYGEQALGKTVHEATVGIVSEDKQCLHKKCAGRHSVEADTVEMVREAFHGRPQMAYLQSNVLFQQDGVPPHWGPYNETASE
jgi:hypothetical protein